MDTDVLNKKYSRITKNDASKSIVEAIENIIKIIGVWTSQDGMPYTIIRRIGSITFFMVNITQFLAIFIYKDDPYKLFECFSIFCFSIVGFLKYLSLRVQKCSWKSLLNQVATMENTQLSSEEEFKFSEHIELYNKRFDSISTLLFRIYFTTVTIFIVSPFIEYAWAIQQGTDYEGYPHSVPGWEPFDGTLIGYICTTVLEGVASVFCVASHTVFDLTAVGLMMFSCGQFTMFKAYCETIGAEDRSKVIYDITEERDAIAHKRIEICLRNNILLKKMLKDLDKMLRPILGIYFVLASLTLCLVAVRLQSKDLNFIQSASLIQYMCGSLTQLFLYCYYGDAVLHESYVKMGEGPFVALTWNLSVRVRREVLLLSQAMMTPQTLHAGPFHSFNLPAFIQIVRTAYSYFAVLRQKSQ